MKKSASDLSCTSVDLYLPNRLQQRTDKECISMKSECGVDNRRRLSVINSIGKKASLNQTGHFVSLCEGILCQENVGKIYLSCWEWFCLCSFVYISVLKCWKNFTTEVDVANISLWKCPQCANLCYSWPWCYFLVSAWPADTFCYIVHLGEHDTDWKSGSIFLINDIIT